MENNISFFIQLTLSCGTLGIAIFFLKRMVTEFDDFRKKHQSDQAELKRKYDSAVEQLSNKIYEIKDFLSEVKGSQHIALGSLKGNILESKLALEKTDMLLKAIEERSLNIANNLFDSQKMTKMHSEVLLKLVHESKDIRKEIESVRIDLGKHSLMFKGKKS